MFIYIYILLQ